MKKTLLKKIIITAVALILVAALITAGVLLTKNKFGDSSGDKTIIYADSVETITGSSGAGSVNRYTGVVETQKSVDVKADSEKTIKTIFVKIGDMVEEGTPLFEYDTEEIKLKLEEANLELERFNNTITTTKSQIEELEKEKKSAPKEEQLSYTAEILSLQSSIQQTDYDIKVKQMEINNLNESLNNAVVKSKAAGVIKSINESKNDNPYGDDGSSAFMTIVAVGDYRVKGTIDEQNLYNISEDMEVIVYSRRDNTTWTGVIDEIDTESPQSNNNQDMFYGGYSDSMGEASSKYAFYVKLNDGDNLIIGQHVYIEPDVGQYKSGDIIKLQSAYIFNEDGEDYVRALNKNDKLEKRKVELGRYDSFMNMYEVKSGIEISDYIAFPSKYCKEGQSVIKDTGKAADDSIYHRDDGFEEDYYTEDENEFVWDESSGMLNEYGSDGNLFSSTDEEGNVTYYDKDGNPVDAMINESEEVLE